MKGIIIDGVAASGKTSIIKVLNRKLADLEPAMTKLFISEHYTERMLEHLRDDDRHNQSKINDHIGNFIDILSNFQVMLQGSKFSDNPRTADSIVILERFILTHLVSPDNKGSYQIAQARCHFGLLSKLGVKQVLLVIPPERFRDRILSTLNYRNEVWKEHLLSRGSEAEIVDYYQRWQTQSVRYANELKDVIDTLVIEVKDDDYEKYSDLIIEKYFVN